MGSLNTNTIATTTALNAKITGLQTALLARAESELGLAKQLIKVKQLSLARPQTTARMNFQEDLDDMLDGSFTLQTIDDLRTTLRTEIGTLSEDSPLWADYHALQVTLDILSLNLRAVANTQHTLTSIENELSPLQNLQSDISTILQDVLADIKARQTALGQTINGESTFWPVVVTALGNLIASYSLSNLSEAIRRLKQARDSLNIIRNLADEDKANALIYRLEQNYETIREKNQSVVNKLADVQSAINNISVDVPAITLENTDIASVLKNAIADIGDTATLQTLKTTLNNLYDGFDEAELNTAITALDGAFTGDDAITDTHAAYLELKQLRFILKAYKVEITERNTNVVRKLTDVQAAITGLELTAGDITVTNTDLVTVLSSAINDIGSTANLQSLKTTLNNLYNGFDAAELTAAINSLDAAFTGQNPIQNTHAAYFELKQLRFILKAYKTQKDATDAVKTATDGVKTATDNVKTAVNAIPAPPSNTAIVNKLSDVQNSINNLELTAGDIDVAAQPDIADLIQGAIVDIGSDTSGNLQTLKTRLQNLYDGFDIGELTLVITAMRSTFTGNGAI